MSVPVGPLPKPTPAQARVLRAVALAGEVAGDNLDRRACERLGLLLWHARGGYTPTNLGRAWLAAHPEPAA